MGKTSRNWTKKKSNHLQGSGGNESEMRFNSLEVRFLRISNAEATSLSLNTLASMLFARLIHTLLKEERAAESFTEVAE